VGDLRRTGILFAAGNGGVTCRKNSQCLIWCGLADGAVVVVGWAVDGDADVGFDGRCYGVDAHGEGADGGDRCDGEERGQDSPLAAYGTGVVVYQEVLNFFQDRHNSSHSLLCLAPLASVRHTTVQRLRELFYKIGLKVATAVAQGG